MVGALSRDLVLCGGVTARTGGLAWNADRNGGLAGDFSSVGLMRALPELECSFEPFDHEILLGARPRQKLERLRIRSSALPLCLRDVVYTCIGCRGQIGYTAEQEMLKIGAQNACVGLFCTHEVHKDRLFGRRCAVCTRCSVPLVAVPKLITGISERESSQ